jgi:hypothetical protein
LRAHRTLDHDLDIEGQKTSRTPSPVPKSIHHLVAPHAWRLPFERVWRNPKPAGG